MIELLVPFLLETVNIDRFVELIDPAGRKTVPHHSLLVSVLMVHDARSEVETDKSDFRQEVENELALLTTPTTYENRNITVA